MVNIDYEELLAIIQSELNDYICNDDNYDIYKDYKFILSSEQQFMKLKDKDSNNIYIVVKFGSSNVFFGQTAIDITLMTLSEENKLNIAQQMMAGFVETYNLARSNNNTIQQVWNSPAVSNNFNAIYAGWRSVIKTSGALIITKNAAYYEVFYTYSDSNGNKYEQKVPTVATSFSLVNSPDTQPFYNTRDFAKSIVQFGVFSLTMTTFLLNDNWVVSKVIDMITGANTKLIYDSTEKTWTPEIDRDSDGAIKYEWPTRINDTFNLEIRFLDGRVRVSSMKLVDYQVTEQIGEIPTLTLTFME